MLIKLVVPESLQNPSTFCRFFFRGEQGTGDMENLVAGGAQAIKNTGFLDATLWATPGYATLGGGAANYCTLPPSAHDFSLAGTSLIITARLQKVAAVLPAAEQYIAVSYNPGTNTGGVILSCRPDGSARCYVNALDGSTVNANTAASVLANGSVANERSLVFFFPREAGSAWSMIDAMDGNSSAAAIVVGKSLAGGRDMRIGSSLAGGVIDGYRIAAFGAYQVPADLASIDRKQVGDWCMRNPGVPCPDWVFA